MDKEWLLRLLEGLWHDRISNLIAALKDTIERAWDQVPSATPAFFEAALRMHFDASDRKSMEHLAQGLVSYVKASPVPFPSSEARAFLRLLRRKRLFNVMGRVGDVMIQSGQMDHQVRCDYCQSLLEEGRIAAALDVLAILAEDCKGSGNEAAYAEAMGLTGRAHKQAYANACNETGCNTAGKPGPGKVARNHLLSSIEAYSEIYLETGKTWHGINLVALLKRAERDEVTVHQRFGDAGEIAESILRQVEETTKDDPVDPWDLPTGAEANLALGNREEALKWIVKFVASTPEDGTDAFAFASTLRQFLEIWGLDPVEERMVHILRAAVLQREGGGIEIENITDNMARAEALESDKHFEQVLGTERFNTFKWYKTGLERAYGVARVNDQDDNPIGTGFIVRAKELHPDLIDEFVLVTNAHVISNDRQEQKSNPASVAVADASIEFEASDDTTQTYRPLEILYTSGRNELDFSVVTFSPQPKFGRDCPVAKDPPVIEKGERPQRVYVIGHPGGRRLSFSIYDNELLAFADPKVHYRAPTEGGSSGSPVFTEDWRLLAIHHAGGMRMRRLNDEPGTYPANEGIYFPTIIEEINRQERDKGVDGGRIQS